MPERENRRLSAIMFADITGYTAMVQDSEEAALEKVAIHRSVLRECTEKFEGEVIQFYGDGSLSIYKSAMDAVRCAICMQKQYLDKEVPVRIGLHLGDIIFRDGTIYGDGVNIASRIEQIGVSGGVLASAQLYREIANHPEIRTIPLGNYNLKNVSEPVELYAIANDGLKIPEKQAGRKTNLPQWAWLALLVLLVAVIAYAIFRIVDGANNKADLEALRQERIAVRFHDFTRSVESDQLASMASYWIGNRIREISDTRVVRYEQAVEGPAFQVATAGINQLAAFSKRTGAVNLLEGAIFPLGDSLQLEAAIYNLPDGIEQYRFDPVKCSITEPMDGIDRLTRQIRGWWASRDAHVLSVPNYDAFNDYLKARSLWITDYRGAETLLKSAIQNDSTFMDAHFMLLDLYYNQQRYEERRKKIEEIKKKFPELTKRQQNLLDAYEAGHRGDLAQRYELFKAELEADHKDLFVNTTGMLFALGYVHNDREAIDLFNEIPVDSLDLANCSYCRRRIGFAVQSYLNLGKVTEAVRLAELLPFEDYSDYLYKLIAFIRNGDDETAVDLLQRVTNDSIQRHFAGLLFVQSASEYALQDNQKMLDMLVAMVEKLRKDNPGYRGRLVECNYYAGNYQKALDSLSYYIENYPDATWTAYYAGAIHARLGNEERTQYYLSRLDTLGQANRYDYGESTYKAGVIHAIIGEDEQAINLLQTAWREGNVFTYYNYQNDPNLKTLFDKPAFEMVIDPLSGR